MYIKQRNVVFIGYNYYSMEELLATDGTMSDEETIATEGINLDEVDEEATDYEEVETSEDEETEIVEEVEQPAPQPKSKNKVAKILAERNEAKRIAEEQAREIALLKLEKTFGEFNHDEVKSYIEKNPTLPVEDAVILWKAKNKPEKPKAKASWIVWSEVRSVSKSQVTEAELLKMDQQEYNKTRDLIDAGKIRFVK